MPLHFKGLNGLTKRNSLWYGTANDASQVSYLSLNLVNNKKEPVMYAMSVT